MNRILRAVVEFNNGTGRSAQLKNKQIIVAGKTGTGTAPTKHIWFIGYIPNKLVTGIWLGNYPFAPMKEHVEGGRKYHPEGKIAAKLWSDYMNTVNYRTLP